MARMQRRDEKERILDAASADKQVVQLFLDSWGARRTVHVVKLDDGVYHCDGHSFTLGDVRWVHHPLAPAG